MPSRELRDRIAAEWPLEPLAAAHPGEVAERYAYADGSGEVGFISSVTQPFCGGCTRARISSDGVFYTCLFATSGTDFRGALRAGMDDDGLRRMIRATWRAREDRGAEMRLEQHRRGPLVGVDALRGDPHLEMHTRGG